MKTLQILTITLLTLFLSAGTALSGESRYSGKVGNSTVRAGLEYYADDTVSGWYVSLKTGKKYLLEGHNKVQGKLFLKEYTKGENGNWYGTSDVYLSKSIQGGKVVWSGQMKNYDGRNVKVVFTKN